MTNQWRCCLRHGFTINDVEAGLPTSLQRKINCSYRWAIPDVIDFSPLYYGLNYWLLPVTTCFKTVANFAFLLRTVCFFRAIRAMNGDYSLLHKVSVVWSMYWVFLRSSISLENLVVQRLVQIFPRSYGTRWFITAFTTALHKYL